MTEKKNNNIFTYATSELSQDAFLFYLLNFANDNSNEGKLARSFLKSFGCDKINENNYNDFKIYSYKQYKHIDLLMLFLKEDDLDNSFILLLEDKINSNESKENQLNSYLEEIDKINREDINGNRIESDEIYKKLEDKATLKKLIVPIYFKTGSMGVSEKRDAEEKAKLIDFEIVLNLMKNQDITNIIINQWKEKIIKMEELNKKINNAIKEDKTIDEIWKLCYNEGCSYLDTMNQFGKEILGNYISGKFTKYYIDSDSYNYNTWKKNARGHPETVLSIKPDLLYKKIKNVKYDKKFDNEVVVIHTQLRVINFDLAIIFEVLFLREKDHFNYKYFDYAKQNFLNNNQELKERFIEEKKKFYEKIYKEINKMIELNPKFKYANLDKMSNKTRLFAKFNWKNGIQDLKFSEFKEFILKVQKILEKTAIECGFDKLW